MATQDFWRENVTVYLIHFNRPLCHARHYLGSAVDLAERIKQHRTNDPNGSKLIAAVNDAGIPWRVVRTWENVPRHFEARLHHQHNTPRLCPCCNGGIS